MDDRVSERQQEFIDFVQNFRRKHGYSPTFKEIAMGIGVSSKGSVSAMAATLEKMGLIERRAKAYRGMTVRHPVQASK